MLDINTEEYLKRFKVYNPSTLFEPDFSLLKESRCILCGNKLRILRNGKRAICTSKKHRKTFTISIEQLKKLSTG